MSELINYISHITHKILSAIIIGIADKLKIIIVIGDKNILPIMQTLTSTAYNDDDFKVATLRLGFMVEGSMK